MTRVVLTAQAAIDIKGLYGHLRERFGRTASEYIASNQEELINHVSGGRRIHRFEEYERDIVLIYTTSKGHQNYYYRIVGNDIELLHVSGPYLGKENVIASINNGISSGRSDHSITTLLKKLDAIE